MLQSRNAGGARPVQLHLHISAVHLHPAHAPVRLCGAAIPFSNHGCFCSSIAAQGSTWQVSHPVANAFTDAVMLGWMQILSQPNTKTDTKFNHTCTFALIALIVASAGLHILNWLLARFTGWHAFSRQIVDRHPFYDAKGLAVKIAVACATL